jgi:hypothetical protein
MLDMLDCGVWECSRCIFKSFMMHGKPPTFVSTRCRANWSPTASVLFKQLSRAMPAKQHQHLMR